MASSCGCRAGSTTSSICSTRRPAKSSAFPWAESLTGSPSGPSQAGTPSGTLAICARSLMIPDLDIYRAAKLVIDRHGEEAALYAAARTAVLAGEGDLEGAAVWRQITAAVEELQRERRPGEAVN